MSEIRRMVHLVRRPHESMPSFFDHPPAVHRSFARCVVPLVVVRSVAIFVRSWVQSAPMAGFVMGVMALALQLLTWACFGWALVFITRLCGYITRERQAFALSTAVSVPLWLGGLFYLIPEDPPALFFAGRVAVLICGSWGVVMLAYAPFAGATHMQPRRAAFVALSSASYLIIYALFFVTTGLLATVVTLMWQGS